MTQALAAQWKALDAAGREKYNELAEAGKAAMRAERGDDEEESAPRKKRASKKNAGPKKPPAPQTLWAEQVGKPALKAAEPSLTGQETKSKLAEQWKSMSEEEQQPWKEKILAAKKKYKIELEEWNKNHPAGEEDEEDAKADDEGEEKKKSKKAKKSKKNKKEKVRQTGKTKVRNERVEAALGLIESVLTLSIILVLLLHFLCVCISLLSRRRRRTRRSTASLATRMPRTRRPTMQTWRTPSRRNPWTTNQITQPTNHARTHNLNWRIHSACVRKQTPFTIVCRGAHSAQANLQSQSHNLRHSFPRYIYHKLFECFSEVMIRV